MKRWLLVILAAVLMLSTSPAEAALTPKERTQLRRSVDQLVDRYRLGLVVATTTSPKWCRPSGSCEVRLAYWRGDFQLTPPPTARHCRLRVVVTAESARWLERTLARCPAIRES